MINVLINDCFNVFSANTRIRHCRASFASPRCAVGRTCWRRAPPPAVLPPWAALSLVAGSLQGALVLGVEFWFGWV